MTLREALVIDAQFPNKEALINVASGYDLNPLFASSEKQAIALLKEQKADVIFFDINQEQSFIDALFHEMKKSAYFPYLIAMGDLTSLTKIVSFLKRGADDYLVKPFSCHHLEKVFSKADLRRKELLAESLSSEKNELIAKSPKMQTLLLEAAKIAKSNANVFIQGESGTGKEVFAKFIHHHSYRNGSPFIRVNCAAICETLIESEFFGHEKGAFTGAVSTKLGRFELADKGSLLLDEISEVPLSFQAKLLRATQEQEIERVGGTTLRKVNVRIISTSNRTMLREIKEKRFREDLYFRLNVIPLFLPPLRERVEDIPALVDHFLQEASTVNEKPLKNLTSSALDKLMDYHWPGNIRELGNVIERLVVLSSKEIISDDEIIFDCMRTSSSNEETSLFDESFNIQPLEEIETQYLLKALEHFNYNKTKTAEALHINVRTLRNKLKLISAK